MTWQLNNNIANNIQYLFRIFKSLVGASSPEIHPQETPFQKTDFLLVLSIPQETHCIPPSSPFKSITLPQKPHGQYFSQKTSVLLSQGE